jgi:hypothetical protein
MLEERQNETPTKPESFSRREKIHPALEYLRTLHKQPPTPQLERFLSAFAEPKSINHENFVAGVKKFIQLANSNSHDNGINREAYMQAFTIRVI